MSKSVASSANVSRKQGMRVGSQNPACRQSGKSLIARYSLGKILEISSACTGVLCGNGVNDKKCPT